MHSLFQFLIRPYSADLPLFGSSSNDLEALISPTLSHRYFKATSFCFRVSSGGFLAECFFAIVSGLSQVGVVFSIFAVVTNEPSILNYGRPLGWLCAAVILRVLSALGSIYAANWTASLISRTLSLTSIQQKYDGAKEGINEVEFFSRDVPLLTEIPSSIAAIAQAASTVIFSVFVFYKMDLSVDIISLFPLLFLVVFSGWIAKNRASLSKKIYAAAKCRTQVSLSFNSYIEPIRRLGVHKALAEWLGAQGRKEVKLRNQDSVFRALDIYSAAFSKLLPVIVVTCVAVITSTKQNQSSLLVLWLASLIASDILSLSRLYPYLQSLLPGIEAYSQYERNDLSSQVSKISFDASWDIFEGSIVENTLSTQPWPEVLPTFNLENELTADLGPAERKMSLSRFRLEDKGANVSAGQKTRILFIRLFSLMQNLNKWEIWIDYPLQSLDKEGLFQVIGKVVECANRNNHRVQFSEFNRQLLNQYGWSPASKSFISSQQSELSPSPIAFSPESLLAKVDKVGVDGHSFSSLITTPMKLNWLSLLSIASVASVAILLAVSANLVGRVEMGNMSVLSLIALLFVGIGVGVFFGRDIESNIRGWVLEKVRLEMVNLKSPSHEYIQLVTRDFQTLTHKMSWYCHDFYWIFALNIVGFISLLSSGSKGVAAFMIVSCFYLMVWSRYTPFILKSRALNVQHFNKFIRCVQTVRRLGSLNSTVLLNLRSSSLQIALIESLHRFQVERRFIRDAAISFAQLGSGVLLVTVCSMGKDRLSLSLLVFLLTALMQADLRIGVLFAASTGFVSELKSVDRFLSVSSQSEPAATNQVTFAQSHESAVNGQNLSIPQFESAINDGLTYGTYSFDYDKVNCVAGPSGSGKTLWLKGIQDQMPGRVIYFDHNFVNILRDFKDFFQTSSDSSLSESVRAVFTFSESSPDLIIFDESCAQLSESSLLDELERIRKYFSKTAVVYVDHRYRSGRVIEIGEVIQSL